MVQIINGFCFNLAAFVQQLGRIGNYVSLIITYCLLCDVASPERLISL